jgi:hypothetical protein
MSWWQRRTVYLIVLGAAALAIAIIVWVRHKSLETDLLAALGVLGALAIIIVAIPSNGKEK